MCAKPCFVHKFNAHDALEDVKALRKILFTAPMQVPNETLVNQVKLMLPNYTFQRKQDTIQLNDGTENC